MDSREILQDMSFFPPLVKKFAEVFSHLDPEIDAYIKNNNDTLASLIEEDERNRNEILSPSSYNITSSESVSLVHLLVGGTALLIESTKNYLATVSKPQRRVEETIVNLGAASRIISELITCVKVAVEEDGFLLVTPWLSKLVAVCHQSMHELTALIFDQMHIIDQIFFIDDDLVQNSFSDTLPREEDLPKENQTIWWNSNVDALIIKYEYTYCNVMEYIFRLLLARRDPDFVTDKEYQNRILETSVNETRRIRKALENFQAQFRLEAEKVESEPEKIAPENRFSRERQIFNLTRHLRKRFKEMDDLLLQLEEGGEQILSKKEGKLESVDIENFSMQRRDFEKLFNSLTAEANRYVSFLGTLEKKQDEGAKLSTSEKRVSQVQDKQELTEVEELPTHWNLSDHKITFEAQAFDDLLYNLEDDDENTDEVYYGSGRLGEDRFEPDSELLSERLVGLTFNGVLDELKVKLTDRKEEMTARELTAFRKAQEEKAFTESADDFEFINEDLSSESFYSQEGDGKSLKTTDESHVIENAIDDASGSVFKMNLMQALNARSKIPSEIFENEDEITDDFVAV